MIRLQLADGKTLRDSTTSPNKEHEPRALIVYSRLNSRSKRGVARGWPRWPSPLRKNIIRHKQLILFTTLIIFIHQLDGRLNIIMKVNLTNHNHAVHKVKHKARHALVDKREHKTTTPYIT